MDDVNRAVAYLASDEVMHELHDHRQARLVVGSQERRAVGGDDCLADEARQFFLRGALRVGFGVAVGGGGQAGDQGRAAGGGGQAG